VKCLYGLCVTVSQALKENSYPFLALIVLRDNRMTVVSRIEGPIGQLLCSMLSLCLYHFLSVLLFVILKMLKLT